MCASRCTTTRGGLTFAWVLKGALPMKFEAPDFNAAATDVAVEELTLAYDGLELEDPTC